MIYYVYIYWDQAIPFYIGMGKNERDISHLLKIKANKILKNKHFGNKIKKILNENREPIIERVKSNISAKEAKLLERELISKYGRSDLKLGPLTNLTAGGDGRCEWNQEQRTFMSNLYKNKVNVVDSTGNKFKVDKSDPRLKTGELYGQNKGIKFKDTSNFNNFTMAKFINGKNIRVKSNDSRFLTGEIVGINSGKKWSEETKRKMSLGGLGISKNKKQCTIDGIIIYNSYTDLVKILGRGKMGARHPKFRYL